MTLDLPPELKPDKCPRCGWPELSYELSPSHVNPETNELVVPTYCLNSKCGIKFRLHFKFDKWEY